MDVESTIAEDLAAWKELASVLDAHPDTVLHEASSTWQWRSRDVYAHLARWITHSTDQMELALAGKPPLPQLEGTDDEINRRWQREDSSLALAEARRRAQAAFERRLRVIRSVPDGGWDARMEELAMFDGAIHYREHLSYIVAV